METDHDRTRYDDAAPRQSRRSGRERGIHIFVPAAELRKAGIDPNGPAPTYRTWGTSKGGVMVRLYTD